MALTTLDPKTALVLIDLQHGIVALPAVPRSGAEVVARGKELADAFRGTDLDTQLRRRDITQIVLAGLVTSRGVDTTAREAYAHNYSVAFAVDAMADRGIEVHENAIERIFPQIGQRTTTAEILDVLAKTRG